VEAISLVQERILKIHWSNSVPNFNYVNVDFMRSLDDCLCIFSG